MKLPNHILELIKIIEDKNFEAFVVGGAVRDSLLGREAKDYDITTNARPEDIKEIFKNYKTLDIGEKFGTVLLIYKGENIEITTYRQDGDYLDGRRPSGVEYTKNIREDLARRDFTINALAYNPKTGIIDYFNGREDLKNKIIKTVGDPDRRFEEDHLRILRCLRFATQLDFSIEKKTYQACKDKAVLLDKISKERIRDELFKILVCKKPSKGIRLMKDLEILDIILPELSRTVGFDQVNKYHDKDVFDHTMCVLDRVDNKIELRLAALLHDLGKVDSFFIDEDGQGRFFGHEKESVKIAKDILSRLNVSNKIKNKVYILVENHMGKENNYSKKGLRRLIYRIGKDNIFDLLNLQKADMSCTIKNRDLTCLINREKDIEKILLEEDVYEKKKLAVNGYDIIELGYKEGKEVGRILDYLMDIVLEDPKKNNRDYLLKLIKNKIQEE